MQVIILLTQVHIGWCLMIDILKKKLYTLNKEIIDIVFDNVDMYQYYCGKRDMLIELITELQKG